MPNTCFFVSRIGDAGTPEREFSDKLLKYIIAPVLEKCGYDVPVRADHITQPGVITTQVFTHLWNDDLVIADLTGSNPNVFYELAVRHVRRKPFVHMIQTGHKIPFDIAPNRTIEFDFDIEKAELAKTALEAMVKAAPGEPANLQTPLSAAVDFSSVAASSDPLSGGISQILSIVQEIKGELTSSSKQRTEAARRREGERIMQEAAARSGEIAAEINMLTQKMKEQPNSKVLRERLHALETQYKLLRGQEEAIREMAVQL